MTPEALRRRMAHGNIYPAERIDAALGNYFRRRQPGRAARARPAVGGRPGRRGARRSTGTATASSDRGRPASGWSSRSPARPAATTWCGGPPAWRPAPRSDLLGVHVRGRRRRAAGARGAARRAPARCWPSSAAATSRSPARDVAEALLDAARSESATQLVLGASPAVAAGRAAPAARWSTGCSAASGPIDVHVISTAGHRACRRPLAPRPRRGVRSRRAGGCSAGCSRSSAPMALAGVLTPQRDAHRALPRCCCSTCWSWWPSPRSAEAVRPLVTAVSSSLYANWFFFPPLHTWTISDRDNVRRARRCSSSSGLVVVVVRRRRSARRSSEANRASAEAETLARLAGGRRPSRPAGQRSSSTCADTFGLQAVQRARRRTAPAAGGSQAGGRASGPPAAARRRRRETMPHRRRRRAARARGPGDRRRGPARVRALRGAARRRGRGAAGSAARPRSRPRSAEADELRTALLAAVSHDLRTPLAVDQGVGHVSLLPADVDWSPEAIEAFARAIDEETDRLTASSATCST